MAIFIVCDDPCKAKCKCGNVCTREEHLKPYSNKSLLDHVHGAHSTEHAQLKQKASKPVETTSSSTIRLLNDKPGSSITWNVSNHLVQIILCSSTTWFWNGL